MNVRVCNVHIGYRQADMGVLNVMAGGMSARRPCHVYQVEVMMPGDPLCAALFTRGKFEQTL